MDAARGQKRLRALFLGNRKARRVAEQLDRAYELLRDAGLELIPQPIKKPEDLPRLIRDYADRVDLVVIGGGDGTLNTAVAALVETRLPLGVLPLGTANDLAHTLGINQDLNQACAVIAAGHTRQIDVGWVNGKHFFNVAGIGMSVEVTKRLTRQVKKRWGVFAYGLAIARVLRYLRSFHAEIRAGGETHRVRTIQITVGNGRYYGGTLIVAEDAAIDDQRLDVYSLEIDHWWHLLPLLRAFRKGKFDDKSAVRTFHGEEFQIVTSARRRINADGELLAYTPATFRVVPRAVTVFAPEFPDPTAGLTDAMRASDAAPCS